MSTSSKRSTAFKDCLKLFDWSGWVTKGGDGRAFVGGVVGIAMLLASGIWLAVAFTSRAYADTTAMCTCQNLDDIRVDPETNRIVNYPETYLFKLCEDHSSGETCSDSCLAESNRNGDGVLCDAGTFFCSCRDDGTCDEGLECQYDTGDDASADERGLCIADLDDGERPDESLLTSGNSVAVNFCTRAIQTRVKNIQRVIGAPVKNIALSEEEERTLKAYARCISGFDACSVPSTPFTVLQVIGSTWGWATLFIVPGIMMYNCFVKIVFRSEHDKRKNIHRQASQSLIKQ